MLFKAFILLSFTLSVLSSDHHIRSNIHHRAIAGRIAAPAPVHERDVVVLHKRQNRRCKPRPAAQKQDNGAKAAASDPPKDDPKTDPKPQPKPDPPKEDPKPAPPPAPKPDPPKVDPPKPAPPPPPPPAPKPDPPKSGEPSFMHGIQRGQGTFYATGLGACGIVNNDNDYIVAVSHLLFDSYPGWDGRNPNNNPMCGRKIRASLNGKSVIVAATDRCEACALTDLDFSPSAFNQLADFSVGRFNNLEWEWL